MRSPFGCMLMLVRGVRSEKDIDGIEFRADVGSCIVVVASCCASEAINAHLRVSLDVTSCQ